MTLNDKRPLCITLTYIVFPVGHIISAIVSTATLVYKLNWCHVLVAEEEFLYKVYQSICCSSGNYRAGCCCYQWRIKGMGWAHSLRWSD